ncbi:MAG: phosphotransferase enzyme family protein [Chitinophagales bacterium]
MDKILNETQEIQIALHQLHQLEQTTITLIRKSVNTTYRVETKSQTYYLRLYADNAYFETTEGNICFELALMQHLVKHGIAIPNPVLNVSGSLLSEIEMTNKCLKAALFQEVFGTPHKAWWPKIVGEKEIRKLGKLIARFHTVADIFTTQHSRYEFDLHFLLDKPLAVIQNSMNAIDYSGDLAFFEETSRYLRKTVEAIGKSPSAYGIIHGDTHVGNVLYEKITGFSLIDFDYCAYGWRIYDLVPLLNTLQINVPDPAIVHRVWQLTLEGYEAIRPFSKREKAALPAFQALWHLWDLGETLTLSASGEEGRKPSAESVEKAIATLKKVKLDLEENHFCS